MDSTLILQWFALAFVFLISSIWSENNVRFGYIITIFMAGFFWMIGWIQFPYLSTVIPMMMMLAILSYLRSHLKMKFGVFGSSGGLLFKIVVFVIFLQFALIFVNGLVTVGVFDQQFAPNPSSEFQSYTISNAETVYKSSTTDVNVVDAVWNGMGLVWTQWIVLWNMVFGFFSIYNTMVTIFKVPAAVSVLLSAGVYILTAIEVFVLVFKPYRAPEV